MRPILSTLVLLAACVMEVPVEEAVESQEIHGSSFLASQNHANRTVALVRYSVWNGPYRFCYGTLIAPDVVLTSARCKPTVHDSAVFHTVPPSQMDFTRSRDIAYVKHPDGVDPAANDYVDDDGEFADIALVKLESPMGAPAVPATLQWLYPGADASGEKIGGSPVSTNQQLRRVTDLIYSLSDASGGFMTDDTETESYDSGGAFFTSGLKVTGVLSGAAWDDNVGKSRDHYTSIAPISRLWWILNESGWEWSGYPTNYGYRRHGTVMSSFYFDPWLCLYACERTSNCVATNFTWNNRTCELLSSVTATVVNNVWQSTKK